MKISIRLLRKLPSFEAQDKKRKEAIEVRNEADSYGIPDTEGS